HPANEGVNDLFEIVPCFPIGKYDRGQLLPVQPSAGIANIRSEAAKYGIEAGAARSHGVPREGIGVNSRNAELCEPSADVTFSRGDPPGQPETLHAGH
ncbi:MAG TPA: hypothetical protein VKC35_12820, partial [Vicinamibacterales bacterium]|nr:hypothetical protein [Vicinamibacterales bacterium]